MPVFVNCTFTRNRGALIDRGAFLKALVTEGAWHWRIFVDFQNCIIYDNQGGTTASGVNSNFQIHVTHADAGAPGPFDISVRNSATNGQTWPEVWYDPNSTTIGENPWLDESALKGPDLIFGTLDDNYRLVPGSPAIDAGFNNLVPVDTFDLDDDGITCERIPIDLDRNPRFADDAGVKDTGCGTSVVVDIGAYEFPGTPSDLVFGDTNNDGTVNVFDLLDVLSQWGSCTCCPEDFNGDHIVDVFDLLEVLGVWGPCS